MRKWIEIITEGSDYNCPNCDNHLGKTSEVVLNNNEICGNCGWEKPGRIATPVVAPVASDKVIGDYLVTFNPSKTQITVKYTGQTVSHVRSGDIAGNVTLISLDEPTYVASWRLDFYHSNEIPGHFNTANRAVAAVIAAHKAAIKELKRSIKGNRR